MKFVVLTLFPEILEGFVASSLIGKAVQRGVIGVDLVNIRSFARDRHQTADDAPYGGGAGMVMLGEPVLEALETHGAGKRILLTPRGRPFSQAHARRLAGEAALTLMCGRYEGLDERVAQAFDEAISIGDFVLAGGEVAAMAVIEAVARLVPGVVGNQASLDEETFSADLLEYPQYTRPEVLRGQAVPAVLLSGDHERIRRWRRWQALRITRANRPDLFARLELSDDDRELLEEDEP